MSYYKTVIRNDKPVNIHRVVVHRFMVGDVDDPDVYAGEPLHQWLSSPAGQWCKEHAIEDMIWQRQIDPERFAYHYAVIAQLSEQDHTWYKLKFE